MQLWPSWILLLLGLWLVAAPWLLGFESALVPRWNSIIVGALVVMFGYLTSIPVDKRSQPPNNP